MEKITSGVSQLGIVCKVNEVVEGKADGLSYTDSRLQLTANGIPVGNSVRVDGGGAPLTQELATVTLSAADGTSMEGQLVTYTNLTKNTAQEFTYANETIIIPVDLGDLYELSVSTRPGFQSPPNFTRLTATYAAPRGFSFVYKTAVRYGVRVKKAEGDPDLRVEYIFDSVGFTPCRMNYETGVFDYGSWESFVKNLCKPCMVNYDLTIRGELNPEDHTKYIDGTDSGISDFATPANAMSVFKKWYQNLYEDADYEYYVISNIKWDDSYTDWHCYNELGQQDYMMLQMFGVSFDGTRLRSIAGKNMDGNKTRAVEITQAKANGPGWYTMTYSKWIFRNTLLRIIGKSTNTQEVFGKGVGAPSSAALQTGTLLNAGMFFGDAETQKQVKIFYCEMPWGNANQALAGWVTNAAGHNLVKLIPPYNTTGAGYTDAGTLMVSSAFIKENKVSNTIGCLPNVTGGSGTTFDCDSHVIKGSSYAVCGGTYSSQTANSGAFYVSVYAPATAQSGGMSGSLSA